MLDDDVSGLPTHPPPPGDGAKDASKDGNIMIKNAEMDNNNFIEVIAEGENGIQQTKFKCKECGHEASRVADIRRHITSKHIKPQPTTATKRGRQNEEQTEEENDKKKPKEDDGSLELSESVIEDFGSSFTSTQIAGAACLDPEDILKELEQYQADKETDETDPNETPTEEVIAEEDYANKSVADVTMVEPEIEPEKLKRKIFELENQLSVGYQSYQEVEQAYQNVTNENEMMKANLRQKEDTILVQLGTINSLEADKKNLEETNDKFKKGLAIANVMKKELDDLRAMKQQTSNNKELKDAKKKIEELQMKVSQLTVSKANAEAETNRTLKLYDHMQEALNRATGQKQNPNLQKQNQQNQNIVNQNNQNQMMMNHNQQNPSLQIQNQNQNQTRLTKCRDFDRGFCSYADSCKFHHPTKQCDDDKKGRCTRNQCPDLHRSVLEVREQSKEKDCPYWLSGECKFDEKVCKKGNHIPDKFNTKTKGLEEKLMKNVMETLMKQQQQQQHLQQLPQQNIWNPNLKQQASSQLLHPATSGGQQQPLVFQQQQQQLGMFQQTAAPANLTLQQSNPTEQESRQMLNFLQMTRSNQIQPQNLQQSGFGQPQNIQQLGFGQPQNMQQPGPGQPQNVQQSAFGQLPPFQDPRSGFGAMGGQQ